MSSPSEEINFRGSISIFLYMVLLPLSIQDFLQRFLIGFCFSIFFSLTFSKLLKEWNFLSPYIVHGIVGGKKMAKGFTSWKDVGRDWQAISEKFQNLDVYTKFWQDHEVNSGITPILHRAKLNCGKAIC